MIIENQKVKIKWISSSRSYYENKGYIFTNIYDEFEVDVKDLQKGSNIKVKCICDVCGEHFERSMKLIYRGNPNYFCCSNQECKKQIRKNTNLKRYGVENPFQSEEKKEKIKQTNLQKYGVENPNQSEELKNKRKQTNLERYGVENTFQAEQFKQKIKQTNLQKYGCEYAAQNEQIKEKQKQTMLKKYGVEHALQNQQSKEKFAKTMYANNKVATSKPQQYLNNLLNGILNYPIGIYNVDIMLEDGFYIEYDGYAHYTCIHRKQITEEEFFTLQNKRDNEIANLGWKLIRIIDIKDEWRTYNDEFYKNLLIFGKNLFKQNSDLKFVVINLNDKTINYNDVVLNFNEVFNNG